MENVGLFQEARLIAQIHETFSDADEDFNIWNNMTKGAFQADKE